MHLLPAQQQLLATWSVYAALHCRLLHVVQVRVTAMAGNPTAVVIDSASGNPQVLASGSRACVLVCVCL